MYHRPYPRERSSRYTTVVLAGTGADSTNVGALAPLYDGRFECVPVPEKTRETAALGSWSLRHGTASRRI